MDNIRATMHKLPKQPLWYCTIRRNGQLVTSYLDTFYECIIKIDYHKKGVL